MDPGYLRSEAYGEPLEDLVKCRSVSGSLLHLFVVARPDSAIILKRKFAAPTEIDWTEDEEIRSTLGWYIRSDAD